MKAMILAAGLGKRLRPLTLKIPKALIEINQKALILYHLEKLEAIGVKEVIINLHYHGDMIKRFLRDGAFSDIQIVYSEESEVLETGGGIKKALPFFRDDPFICVNADVYTHFDFRYLKQGLTSNSLGKLILVENPAHNPAGDFSLDSEGKLLLPNSAGLVNLTFSGISVLSPELFDGFPNSKFPLADVFLKAIPMGLLSGLKYDGPWYDVGSPERLNKLQKEFGDLLGSKN
ncbi:MAG: hypothetical protein CMQ39_01980 [Gammaproteobacteria bacterium]|nr:hypothetical protein [Gammaproteobacteria bacterium]